MNTLFDLLVSSGQEYLHFVGELLVLNQILKSGNFRLLGVESVAIAGNRTPDFTFEHLKTGSTELVEVINVHLDERNTQLVKRLSDQFTRKLAKKIKGEAQYNEFYLVPVVWSPLADLERVWHLYQAQAVPHPAKVLEPMAFVTTTYTNGVDQRFGTISTLLAEYLKRQNDGH